jgi:hypothetical protein
VVVVETKYKGLVTVIHKVFGLENGLKCLKVHLHQMKMMVFLFTLASLEGFGERYPYQIYMRYSAATIKFNANFA